MGIWLCSRERRKSRALHRPATGEQSVNGRERIGSDTVKNFQAVSSQIRKTALIYHPGNI